MLNALIEVRASRISSEHAPSRWLRRSAVLEPLPGEGGWVLRALRLESTWGNAAVKIIGVTQWPNLQPDFASPRRTVLLSLVSAIAGGVIGWSLVFAGLGFWGLALGAATALLIMVAVARFDSSQALSSLAAHGIAFVLLTWPFLWIVVGLVRYWLTGQSLGD